MRPIIGNLRRRLIRQRKGNEPVLKTSGSWLLLHEMYRKDEHYKERIGTLLFDKGVFPPEIFDTEEIQKTWQTFVDGSIGLHFEIEALLSFGSLNKMIPCNGISEG